MVWLIHHDTNHFYLCEIHERNSKIMTKFAKNLIAEMIYLWQIRHTSNSRITWVSLNKLLWIDSDPLRNDSNNSFDYSLLSHTFVLFGSRYRSIISDNESNEYKYISRLIYQLSLEEYCTMCNQTFPSTSFWFCAMPNKLHKYIISQTLHDLRLCISMI